MLTWHKDTQATPALKGNLCEVGGRESPDVWEGYSNDKYRRYFKKPLVQESSMETEKINFKENFNKEEENQRGESKEG